MTIENAETRLHAGATPPAAEEFAFDEHDFEFAAEGDFAALAAEPISPVSFTKEAMGRLARNRGALCSLFFIVLIVLFALIGPLVSGYSYEQQLTGHDNMAPRIQGLEKLGFLDGREAVPMSTGVKIVNKYEKLEDGETVYHWFGTDVLGRDLFTRTWEGTRISLFIALVAVLIDMLFGMSYGLISGYFGGKVDMVMQRIVEVLHGIPNLIIITLLIIVLKPGLLSIILALMLTGWIGMSRVARAQMIKLKEQEFVLAARTLGARPFFLISKEVLPNIIGQLLVMSMFSIPSAIFSEAFLAFIGIGIPVPMASLGSIISDSFKSLTAHPYMMIFPVVVLGLLMLSFNLLADGLRDALDPRMKDR
ncbi:MAG: ABC transporter permease [Christensenellaceae bacterium]|jgi:oligopeptide transport system permease protein|nr:ABC transporter permease [Christensenellaceae bacterium]